MRQKGIEFLDCDDCCDASASVAEATHIGSQHREGRDLCVISFNRATLKWQSPRLFTTENLN